ncbi:MAG: hypothetical protein IH859_04100 [Chloroflexi bacterium]|nr:hypothetical protein [Chloroflexota bacterium]
MNDTGKTCLGFIFLIAAVGVAILALVLGGIGSAVEALGGRLFGLNLETGAIVGLVAFAVSALLAVYLFFQVKNLSWLPIIISGVYTILPDILPGPADDAAALIVGALLSGFLAWRRQKNDTI